MNTKFQKIFAISLVAALFLPYSFVFATTYNYATGSQTNTGYNTATGSQSTTVGYNTATGGQVAATSNTATGAQTSTGYNTATGNQSSTGYNTATGAQTSTGYNTATGSQVATTYNTATGSQTNTGYNGATGSQVNTGYNTATGQVAYNPACSDGIDNDGDGKVDMNDPGCTSASDNSEYNVVYACSDGVDNDGDGKVDMNDPGCTSASDNSEYNVVYACADGVDNDGDGKIDYPADPGCYGATDNNEYNAPAVVYACSDGVDNDGDGKIDMNDPGCTSSSDNNEYNQVINNPPVWNQTSSQEITAGQTLNVTVSASDPEGDSLTYSSYNIPANSSFNASTRVFTFTPSTYQQGYFTVRLAVADAMHMPVLMSFYVLVRAGQSQNQNPVCSSIASRDINVNQTLNFTVPAYDPDGDSLYYTMSGSPANSNLNSTSGYFTFTPSTSQKGQTYYTNFSVSDSRGGSCNQSVTIRVLDNGIGSNQPPIWNQQGTRSVRQGEYLSFDVSAYDPDGDFLTYSSVQLPAGAVFDANQRRFNWTPTSSQLGYQNVKLRVSDNVNPAVDMTFYVQVLANGNNGGNNSAPYFIGNQSSYTVYAGSQLQFSINATDPDGDYLNYSSYSLPSGSSFNSYNRTFTWTPNSSQVGTHSARFTASDGVHTSAEFLVTIQVLQTGGGSYYPTYPTYPTYNNNPPYFTSTPNRVAGINQTYIYDANAYDPDGDYVTYSAVQIPVGAYMDYNSGLITWVPTFAQSGQSFQFSIRAMDSRGLSASQTFTVFAQGIVLGATTDYPYFPSTGGGFSDVNMLLIPLALIAFLSAIGMFFVRRLSLVSNR
ncbi:MAG: hypothetical protein COU10_00395 [Candidatus Harrisonbacteria bacterium CG10_big_fil_rev_8_21_14_0_10_45_28]|uniref:Dystroglycan-type cadherin-like domain-containing protein n=1 Tax=Candidatus Harrisonbacteria bacterium CG10_big_fil_rev_8_21_14_0_10_45_28 TaxID=1974586 RepID=A0A2H0URB9_9BACT|nr:MAG: hypothetical protein COU10_00395 [Candidatus Harrisonbacteria bacterium CG10_big_fil_rev_8_21_14_0_10_45_28]